MALTVENNNSNQPAPAKEQASQAPAPSQPAAFNQPRRESTTQAKAHMSIQASPFSMRSNRGISRSTTSETMRLVLEQLNKIAESEKQDNLVDYTFIPLDAEKDGLNISALVVVATPKNAQGDQKVAAFHTLLMASTAKGVSFREAKVGSTGVSYERLVLPTDGYDSIMVDTILKALAAQFPGYRPLSAEWTVIPSTQDLQSENSVRNLAANATTAAWTMMAVEVGGMGWNIQRDLKDMRIVAEIKKSHAHFTDLTGLPVRSDGVIELNEVTGRRGNSADELYNNGQSVSNLMQLNFFIDLAYAPMHTQAMFGDTHAVSNESQLQTYRPRMVVTNVDSPESCDLTLQLLGLATTQLIAESDRPVTCLINQHKDGEANPLGGVNLRDLGGIGLEVPRLVNAMSPTQPVQERFPTASAAFSDQSLAALIRTYVSNDLLVSIDVQEGGPSTWMTSTFAAAARGDEQAIKDIFAAADILTGGIFTPLYQQRCGGVMENPVFDDNLIVNLGTYMDTTGLRDIRDIAYLEVLNLTGDRDLSTITDWANLQANAEVDEHFRAYEARRILSDIFKSMQITGRARRVTLNNQFRYTLALAIKQAGLVYEVKSSSNAPVGTARMSSNYLNQQANNLGNTGAFVSGGFSKTNAATAAPGTFGRFSFQNQVQGGGNGASY